MPRKHSGGNTVNDVGLDGYGIYRISSLDRADHCPKSVYKTFQLVNESRYLQMIPFLERPERKDRRNVFDTDAAHDYNLRLGLRAEDLANRCSDSDKQDASEMEWARLLSPRVFLSFDRQEEENSDTNRPFHHWYATYVSTVDSINEFRSLACRRHFRPGSRPIINTSNTDRSRTMRAILPQRGENVRQDFELW